MKILVLVHSFGEASPNAFGPLTDMLVEIAKQGNELYVLCEDNKYLPMHKYENITLFPVVKSSGISKIWYLFRMYKQAGIIIKREGIDLVYSHILNYLGCVAGTVSLVYGKPFVHWLCSDGREMQRGEPFIQKILNWVMGGYIHWRSRKMITSCEWIAKEQSEPYGIDWRLKYDLSPNCVNLARFKRQNAGIDLFNNGDPVVCYISRLSKRKGADIFIDAVVNLINSGIRINALIFGDGNLKAYIEEKIAQCSEPERVRLMGSVPSTEIPQYLWASSLFCVPARYQGFGRVYVEAMAAGVPVITTDLIPTRSVITHDIDGILCEPKTDAIEYAIISLINDPGTSLRLSQNALSRVNREYATEHVAHRYIEIFEGVSN